MFEKIDSGILAACTKFSHALQRMTGLTNYFVAKIGVALVAVSLLLEVLNQLHPFLRIRNSWVDLLFDALIFATLIDRSLQLTKAEDSLWAGKNTKPIGLMKYTTRPEWRLLWMVLLIVNIIHLFYNPPQGTLLVP